MSNRRFNRKNATTISLFGGLPVASAPAQQARNEESLRLAAERTKAEKEEKEKQRLAEEEQERQRKIDADEQTKKWIEEAKREARLEVKYMTENTNRLILATPRFVVPDEYYAPEGFSIRHHGPLVEIDRAKYAEGLAAIVRSLKLSECIRCQTQCGHVYRPKKGGKQEQGLQPGINRLQSGCHVCWVIANLPNDGVLDPIFHIFGGELHSDRRLRYETLMGHRTFSSGESLRSRLCIMSNYVSQIEYDVDGIRHPLTQGCLVTVEAYYRVINTPSEHQVESYVKWSARQE